MDKNKIVKDLEAIIFLANKKLEKAEGEKRIALANEIKHIESVLQIVKGSDGKNIGNLLQKINNVARSALQQKETE